MSGGPGDQKQILLQLGHPLKQARVEQQHQRMVNAALLQPEIQQGIVVILGVDVIQLPVRPVQRCAVGPAQAVGQAGALVKTVQLRDNDL